MVAAQHSGGGKANQYFLRGFNLDHGTDFAGSIDGVPLNFRAHPHMNGYHNSASSRRHPDTKIPFAQPRYT